MKQRKNILIPVTVVVIITAIYYAAPALYDWYLDQWKQDVIWSIIKSDNQVDTDTGSLENTWSIHNTMSQEYHDTVEGELPKLTKQTRALLDQYSRDPDPSYLFNLVESLTSDGAYYTAIYLYQILLKAYPDTATYTDYLTLLINRGSYTPQFLAQYQKTINILSASGYINKQDALLFTSFRTLISGDVDGFYQIVHQLTGEYAPLAWDLLANLTSYSEYKQAPKQYLRWLFASTLLRYGYYTPAIHLAQESLKFNPDYVLGEQVMAYWNLMTHDWTLAKNYLTKLMESDPQHLITYQRLYGIASYRDQNPKDTVRYLTQVNSVIPSIEMIRYLWLSYRSLYDYLHVAKMYRELLTLYEPQELDYFEFFDTYRRAVSYQQDMSMSWVVNPIDTYDNALLSDYVVRCNQTMKNTQSYICSYGEWLQLLFNQDIDGSLKIMIDVARNYPYDFVFGMIGDLYLINWQAPTAQIYYEKAIKSSYNWWYQSYLSNKINNLIIDDGLETN